MQNFEKKFGKFAIRNLSSVLLVCYFVGFLMLLIEPLTPALLYLTLDPEAILHGQVWRIVTWIFMPASGDIFGTIINMFFFYFIGRTLERLWGDFLCNIYIISGMFFTVAGAFIYYGYCRMSGINAYELSYMMTSQSLAYNAVSIFLCAILIFAFCFPDNQVLLFLLFPIKMKWFGLILLGYFGYLLVRSDTPSRIVVISALLNFLLFFLLHRAKKIGSPRVRVQQAMKRREFNNEVKRETRSHEISKHKCAICGRTELDNPDLEFRFCSKCNGNYEYCSDHLFSHKHVE